MNMTTVNLDIIREFRDTPAYLAALYHRSARRPEALERLGVDTDKLDAWDTLGIEVINLFASRLSLNNPSCRSAGAASIATRALVRAILDRLGTTFERHQLGVFGECVSIEERKKPSSYANIIRQLVGAVAFREGYSSAVTKSILSLLKLEEFSVDVGKEEKTSLQEILQRTRLRPTYETIAVYGKANKQTFRVRVHAAGKSADGEGGSRRLAEQAAAAAYLALYYPRVSCTTTLRFQPELTVSSIIESIPSLENRNAVAKLIKNFQINDEVRPLFCLAFTHASYGPKSSSSIIGKDNKVLAFLGSQVLKWATKDAATHSMTNRDIKIAGGLRAIIPILLDENAYLTFFESLALYEVLLLGAGEKEIIKSSKIEFVQAFCGALFLARGFEDVSYANEFFNSIQGFNEFFSFEIDASRLTKDIILFPKTVLQERCQGADIQISYQTKFERYGGRIAVLPKIKLHSPWVSSILEVIGNVEITEANKSRRKGEMEGELAEAVISVFDYVRGYAQDRYDLSLNYVADWMFDHFSGALKIIGTGAPRSGRANIAVGQSFALPFLREYDFYNFSSWWRVFSEWVEERDFQSDMFVKFYGRAGHGRNADKRQNKLSYNLRRLAILLNELDPLKDTVDVRATPQYKALLQDAIIHKLLGSGTKASTIKSFLSDVSILFKSEVYVADNAASSDLELLEVDGAPLALLNFLCNLINDGILVGPVMVTISGPNLVFCIKKLPGTDSVTELLAELPLWDIFVILLPIVGMTENEVEIAISVSTTGDALSKRTLSYWWAYQLNGALGKAANDVIASMLHDLKNNVLGYCSASQNALSIATRERYHVAAQANEHLSRSISTIRALSSFLESTVTQLPSPVNIEEFLRQQISRTWSWLPGGVKLVAPTGWYSEVIWTNQASLQSIIENLLKNAVEAMSGNGVIHFECELIGRDSAVSFTIRDNAGGFSESQLQSLNSGAPIGSTKSQGHGIGLLTVLLLVKDLGGQVEFSNDIDMGAIVRVWIPSEPPTVEIDESVGLDSKTLIIDN